MLISTADVAELFFSQYLCIIFSGTGSGDKDSDSELLTSPFANSFTTLQELMKHHKEVWDFLALNEYKLADRTCGQKV